MKKEKRKKRENSKHIHKPLNPNARIIRFFIIKKIYNNIFKTSKVLKYYALEWALQIKSDNIWYDLQPEIWQEFLQLMFNVIGFVSK